MPSIDGFDYQRTLDRAFAPLIFAGQEKLDRAKEDYHRRLALEDEARRRSEYMSDVGAQREFLKQQRQTDREEKDAEVQARYNREDKLKQRESWLPIKEASEYPKPVTEWTEEDATKAKAILKRKMVTHISAIKTAEKELDQLVRSSSEVSDKKVIASILADPTSIDLFTPGQREALQSGKSFEDIKKSMGTLFGAGKWPKFVQTFEQRKKDLIEQQKGQVSQEAAMKMKDLMDRSEGSRTALGFLIKASPGVAADAYAEVGQKPPEAVKPSFPADRNSAYKPVGPGQVVPVSSGTTPAGAALGPPAPSQSASGGQPSTDDSGLMKAPWQDYGIVPQLAGAGVSGLYNGLWADGFKPFAGAAYNHVLKPAGRAVFTGNPVYGPEDTNPTRQPPLPLPGRSTAPPTDQPPAPPQPDQLNQAQLSAGFKAAGTLFGTTDVRYLAKLKAWYIQNSGMPPAQAEQDVNSTIEAAVRGNPEAIRKIQSVVSKARMYIPQDLPGGSGVPLDRPQTPFQPQATPVYQGPQIGPP